MFRMYKHVLPEVDRELSYWESRAGEIPDEELRTQALGSIRTKRFHCQGGAVYAAADPASRPQLVSLIVALQTISDYLDNLCDRSSSLDPADFRLLHQAMHDAAAPGRGPVDYYGLRQTAGDGGYLAELVVTCQRSLAALPSYRVVLEPLERLITLYADLQVYKHIAPALREQRLRAWWQGHQEACPHLHWYEFAAAAGSTLGMFALFLAAAQPALEQEEAVAVSRGYFPHVSGLHILLDYLIDQEEDRREGDLNFCAYYEDTATLTDGLEEMAARALADVQALPAARFHRMVIEGLLALYLSDAKVREQEDVRHISRTIMRRSPLARLFFWMNSRYIRSKSKE
ncbi:tetraprenyl-beta-curcumene synthase family protein [Paenibacillus sp. 1P07SE]|uniref:tetraprenyl-beta-curcumene synthase family protein n=1 Tax=Paenibacillus sp. 1P07SE TaxID=3132209 RepID=UPI0039A49813